MTAMLDGNAIAGTLWDAFGGDMTASVGTCGACGMSAPLGAARVYSSAIGTVVRCPRCDSVTMVFFVRAGMVCLDVGGFAALGPMPAFES